MVKFSILTFLLYTLLLYLNKILGFAELQYARRFYLRAKVKKIQSEDDEKFNLTKDMRLRGYLIEMYKVTSSRESIYWVKPQNLRKNMDISGIAANRR